MYNKTVRKFDILVRWKNILFGVCSRATLKADVGRGCGQQRGGMLRPPRRTFRLAWGLSVRLLRPVPVQTQELQVGDDR